MASILQIINADRNLSYFSKALKVSGLEDQLNESGPFTLLSPVNLAFGRMDVDREEFLLPAHRKKLVALLSDHILTGKKMLDDFRSGRKFKTISGKEVTVNLKNGEICINNAMILARDRQGKNGVVHSIDAVYDIEAK
jgi:uncharacterized surface protein with fasciclin (FAS1) repeats